LLGLSLAGISLATRKERLLTFIQRRSVLLLLLFAVLFTLFMNLGAKKFDRYLLPVYLPLDLVAGVGWVTAANWIRQRSSERFAQSLSSIILLAAVVGQTACTAFSYPYYLSYYNPLLGGIRRAPEVMMVGWGEGLDQAARFLNSQPGAQDRQVATGVWSTTFSYFYNGPVVRSRFEVGSGSIEDWMASDYYVMYINEEQREKVSHDLTDYFATVKPVQVVRINGLDYVYVYDIRNLPPPTFLILPPTEQSGGS
jgi:hypothetical protein